MTDKKFSFQCVFVSLLLLSGVLGCQTDKKAEQKELKPKLNISENRRFFTDENGKPFFWLGDTGWLLFSKLDRQEAIKYLDDRQKKGFNVIQVMILHSLKFADAYGDSALVNKNVARPYIKEGISTDSSQDDYWDHVDFIVDEAGKRGIFMAMVPVWGNNVKSGRVSRDDAKTYASWLADRYKNKRNIIWLNGGDIMGTDSTETWKIIGNTLKAKDPNHLVTFHPFGRRQSSAWFHDEPWLDFNMFQSGHRDYAQDIDSNSLKFGEDNWRYIQDDYSKTPVKPTLDGEPSYEGIPHGLHDPNKPLWTADDVRRYAYWSVFAGGSGFTYGNSAVMQMLKPTDNKSSYGAKSYWYDEINAPGASQMIFLKNLMLSKSYFDRIPDQSLIADNGEKYNRIVATRGKDYVFAYTYNGRNFKVNLGTISGEKIKASWYNPRNGKNAEIGDFDNQGVKEFDPPGNLKNGNDWVLVLSH
ncbi:Putative collagen-binding domain of a collagenase [Dyadobacter koreensis]|uniref:Putative collagen-binding domain of a collagenase n=1 Tax=Dyadobacter koreensis TaxID=408657 RepID=A0A1H6XN70_9BACT|nr:glycoside hydrolase family 140 protein [Dyadobacter koreensis]SEJ30521.1 Putative collagen-binding domain of a collagenase [Dyadobacter koreensis]